MLVYFDTVRRKRPVKNAGELIQLDWTTKNILKTVPIFPFDPDIDDDPNPRGNSRGGKGIVISGSEILVGTYHSIMIFDGDLNYKQKITNNLFVNIHEMCVEGENVWVSSTAIDAALLVDRQGATLKSWWSREEPLLRDRYDLQPMIINKNEDNRLVHLHAEVSTQQYHTHLNSVFKSGLDTYVLLNKQGVIVQIEPEVKLFFEDPLIKGGHSPAISKDGTKLFLCSSFRRSILMYDFRKKALIKEINLSNDPQIAGLYRSYPDEPFNQSLFVRGLQVIDERRILAGISPASLIEIDFHSGNLLDCYRYSEDVGDAVHGLVCMPKDSTLL